jgi:hypothetical protein
MVRATRVCSWCGEEVRPEATVCRHCGNDPRWTPEQIAAWDAKQARRSEERERFYWPAKQDRLDRVGTGVGVLVLLVLIASIFVLLAAIGDSNSGSVARNSGSWERIFDSGDRNSGGELGGWIFFLVCLGCFMLAGRIASATTWLLHAVAALIRRWRP